MRANKIGFHLVGWRRFIGPFRANRISDIHDGIRRLKTAPGDRRVFTTDKNADPQMDDADPATGTGRTSSTVLMICGGTGDAGRGQPG